MTPVLSAATAFALGCYALASVLVLLRLVRGPRAQDRVFALDMLYMHAVLMIMVVGLQHKSDRYFEIALLLVLFGFVSSVAMAKFILRGEVIE